MQENIIIPRGKNVGQSIKDALISKRLYSLINILTFDIKRNRKERTITVTITYDYSSTNDKTNTKT